MSVLGVLQKSSIPNSIWDRSLFFAKFHFALNKCEFDTPLARHASALHRQAMTAAPKSSRAWPIVSLVILLGMGAFNLFLPLFIVPKFEEIYAEALPGMPLPVLTRFIIAARIPLMLIALAWSMAGIAAVWRRSRAAIWIVNFGLLFFFALIWITTVALLMPRVVFIAAMSDASLTSPASSR
jgi:hypothetical protein